MKRISVPLLLALLVLLAYGDLLTLPPDQAITGYDLNHLFLQWWRFALDSLRGGELPLWNPYLFSGVPFLANPQPALLYPPTWLLLVRPAAQAAAWLVALHLWLAAVGMYAWLRREGADRAGATLGAVVLGFSGYLAARTFAGHLGVVMTQAWLPLILWAYRASLARRRWLAALPAGLPVAMSLLAGHTASFLYVALALAAYALFYGWQAWQADHSLRAALRPLGLWALMQGVGLALAAIQLLPTLEFIRLTTRQQTDYAFASRFSWPPAYLLTLLIPNLFGEPGRLGYWGDGAYEELVLYAGVLPLLLALALVTGRAIRHRLTTFLSLLAGGGLFLALGEFGVLHRLAYRWLPLFGSTRAPARAGFLLTFGVAALAGLALTHLRRDPSARGMLRPWVRGPLPWLLAGLGTLLTVASLLLYALQRETNPQIGRLWHVANNSALFVLFLLLSVGLLYLWATRRLTARQGTILVIALTLLDLWGFARTLIQPVTLTENAYWRLVAEMTAGGDGRVLPWGLGIFEHNYGMAWGVRSVFGYDPLELSRYEALTTAVPDPRARAYDLLNARYLVTTLPSDGEGLPLLAERDGVYVYERPNAFPPAWLVHQAEVHPPEALLARLNASSFDLAATVLLERPTDCPLEAPAGAEQVHVTRRGNNRLTLEVHAAADGILVLSESAYPGWRAAVDGRAAPILRADYALRAVCVPAGDHQVTLTFAPLSLEVGAGITLATLLLTAWAAVRLESARRR